MEVAQGRLRILRLLKFAGEDLLPLDLLVPIDPDLARLLEDRASRDLGGRSVHVSLRVLKRRLPHIPTEQEERLLARFEELTACPSAATAVDVEALVVGWRTWWREKRIADITAMADLISREIVARDRWLATYALAARIAAQAR